MFIYAPPANIDDLAGRPTRTAFLDAWHQRIKGDFDTEIAGLPSGNKLFFSEVATAATSAELPVTWNAFPLVISRDNPTDNMARWEAADQLRSADRRTNGAAAPRPSGRQDE